MHVKKGDTVLVLSGNDKGKEGKVLKVFPEKDRVIVEKINMIKRHQRPNQINPQGGLVEKEAPIHVSNVMPWSDQDGKGVRVRMGEEKGKKVRVSATSGAVLAAAPVQTGGEEAEGKKDKDGDD